MAYAQTHSRRGTAKHFGLNRKTVRRWCAAWHAGGLRGLIPRYVNRRPRHILPELVALDHGGAARPPFWRRAHTCVAVARPRRRPQPTTIHRTFRAIGMPYLTKPKTRRRPKQLRLFEKDPPGDSVQVDVKVIRLKRERVFQYTALDDCTQFRVLRLYRRLARKGREEPQNRRRRLLAASRLAELAEAEAALHAWEHRYHRCSMALGGLTPAEKLRAKLTAAGPTNLVGPDHSSDQSLPIRRRSHFDKSVHSIDPPRSAPGTAGHRPAHHARSQCSSARSAHPAVGPGPRCKSVCFRRRTRSRSCEPSTRYKRRTRLLLSAQPSRRRSTQIRK